MLQKKKIFIICFFVFVFILLFANYNSYTNQWKRIMKAGAYKEAAEFFLSEDGIDPDVVKEVLSKHIEDIKSDFRNQTLTYDEATGRINTLSAMLPESDTINEALDYLKQLNASTSAFIIAEEKYAAEEYKQAISYYKQVISDDINYSNATAKLTNASAAYRESILANADKLQLAHAYEDANNTIAEALLLLENDSVLTAYQNTLCDNALAYYKQEANEAKRMQDYSLTINHLKTALDFIDICNGKVSEEELTTLYTEYRDTAIIHADNLQASFHYTQANDAIINALSVLKNDSALTDYQNSLYINAKTYYEEKSNEAKQQQDYLLAMECLKSAVSFESDSEKTKAYTQEIKALQTEYCSIYLAEADTVFQAAPEKYMEAASILEPLINAYPDETSLKDKYNFYLSCKPVELFAQEPFQKSTYFDGTPYTGETDNHGNKHKYMYTCGGIYVKDADWKLKRNYNLLTGIVGVPSGDYATNVNGKVRIYGDGNLLWEKTGIDASTPPEEISIDISGVDVLQISMDGGAGAFSFCSVMVADFMVQKTKP